MREYIEAEIEIVAFESEDVVTISDPFEGPEVEA